MRKIVAIALLALPLLGGCGKAKEGKVLALVDGQRITEEAFRKEAENLPPYIKPLTETAEGKVQLLEGMVTRELLMREAFRRGIDRRPDVMDRVETARQRILLDALLKDVTEKAAGDEAAMRKQYEANRESYRVGERVRVSHLLFRDKEKTAAYAERAKGGAGFEALMKEARAEGGITADLGFIEKGKFDESFEAAVFAAPADSIIGPVKTMYGFHVIKVGERRPAGIRSFDEVKLQLLAESQEKVQRQAFDQLLNALKKRSRVRFFMAGAGEEAVMLPRGPKEGAAAPGVGKGDGDPAVPAAGKDAPAPPAAPAGKGPVAPGAGK